jgi:tetratricopeptide (TPR) repeat protein
MRFSSLLVATLPGFAILGVTPSPPLPALSQPAPTGSKWLAAALSTTQVAAIAEQIMVRIDGQNPGSGFLLARQGQTYYVLTAAHVVATPDEYDVVTPDGQKYKLDYAQVKKLPGADLAVVQFTSSKVYPVAKLGDSSQVRRGMPTFVAGWPAFGSNLTRSNLQFQPGLISAISQTQQNDGYGLVYSNNTLPGMSGGAVFNDQGEVIGIHGRGEAERLQPTENSQVVVKLGFNQGVPINTFLALLPKTGLQLGLRNVQPPQPPVATAPSQTADDLLLQGLNFFRAKNYRQALQVFDQAIQLEPKDARLFTQRGRTKFNLRDPKGALTDLNQALQLDPKDSNFAYLHRGNIYAGLMQFPSALADYNQGIQLNPNANAELYIQRSKIYERLNNRLQSIMDLNQALRLQPLSSEAYGRRGSNYAALPQPRGQLAMNDLNMAIRLDFRNADAYYGRAGLHAQMGNRAQAISDYQRAAQFYLGQGNFEMHRKAQQQLLQLR